MEYKTRQTFGFFWRHVARHKILAGFMVFGLVLGVAGSMVWPILLREFFDILVSDQGKDLIVEGLLGVLGLLMVTEAFQWVGWRIAQYLSNHFYPRIMADIANECFAHMHTRSFRFFSDNFVGSLVKKVNRFVRGFERIFDKLFWDFLPLVLKLLIILAVLTWLNPQLGGIMMVWAVIFIFLQYKVTKYKLRYDIAKANQDSKVTAALADSITNNTNVKLFSASKYESGRFGKVMEKWRQIAQKEWDIDSHIQAGQAFLMVGLEFVILYMAIRLWEADKIGVADFFLIQAYLLETFHQLWDFGRHMRDIYQALADSEEMTVILETPLEISDKAGAVRLRATRGEVEFDKVSFAYGKDDVTVLKNLSLNVKPGERIALIGPSGGGKSTIVKLLLRLFDIQKGKILIDGQNIADCTQDSLREAVSLVPQDPILFHRTLIENIRYGRRGASNAEVVAASKMAHCHEFIKKFPKKYETFVGERGIKLSGGQRQRVAIARAILSNARILVLDEATSSLDSESEMLIQDALEALMKQKTTFIIAHRLSTIMRADRIFVLDGGKIVEEGTHADLVAQSGGLYKKLWELQVGGYL